LDCIVNNLLKRFLPALVDKFGMEEHLGSEEALVANIDIDDLTSKRLVGQCLEAV